jgi:hypothetical protein
MKWMLGEDFAPTGMISPSRTGKRFANCSQGTGKNFHQDLSFALTKKYNMTCVHV